MAVQQLLRVYDLAKKLGLTNKELMDKIHALGIDAKQPSSGMSMADAVRVANEYGYKGDLTPPAPPKPAPKPKPAVAPESVSPALAATATAAMAPPKPVVNVAAPAAPQPASAPTTAKVSEPV